MLFEAPLPAVMCPWTITWTRPLKGLARLIVTVLLVLLGLTLRIASALVKSVSLCFFTIFVTAAKTWYRPEPLAELDQHHGRRHRDLLLDRPVHSH